MSIQLTLNGKSMELPDESSLYDLIVLKKWKLLPMTVRIDDELIENKDRSSIKLCSGQDIKIMPFFGGG